MNKLDQQIITEGIHHSIDEVFVFDTIDSTNTEAKKVFQAGNNINALFISNEQTAGRGRQGKSFYSPADTGLYMTLLLQEQTINQTNIVDLPTIKMAVSVSKAFNKLTGKNIQVKWVNDIFYKGYKVGGILTEKVYSPAHNISALVIGIGINISTTIFPNELKNIAGAINEQISRNHFAIEITNAVMATDTNLGEIIEEYKQISLVLGKTITFMYNNECVTGVATDINDKGHLIVRLPNNSYLTLNSGEISLTSKQFI
ncbi:MAG TPA: biotin--[acetyl-CoA-carboxylase] ligase [Clostridia bacterium]|mgnify:CR=1 FL=1|jgi:BirA family biotin operon repressor/biotin-[acetyl-CoA-carboxylase] ligase|nr:biotin--[acetyl-CoA-carboxylase] ligase [Clostridia bacterium]